jgi:hypothetical protein
LKTVALAIKNSNKYGQMVDPKHISMEIIDDSPTFIKKNKEENNNEVINKLQS